MNSNQREMKQKTKDCFSILCNELALKKGWTINKQLPKNIFVS